MPAETGVQIYNSFRKMQKNGEKNENFRHKAIIFRIIYYFYIPEKDLFGDIKGNRKH